EPLDLFVGSSAADHAQPLLLRDLRRDTSDGARRSGDVDRLAGFDAADVHETNPRGEPRHAEDAKRGGGRRSRRVELAHVIAFGDSVLTPAQSREHPVARGETRVARLDDAPNGTAVDRRADIVRIDVRADPTHAAAHVWVDRDEDVP